MAQVLRRVRDSSAARHPDLIVGVRTLDDAGVYRITDDLALVQTVDFFAPVVDDPHDWGRIAAANALSDVYAMGGRPLTALQLVGWPRGRLAFDVLEEVVAGGIAVLDEAGCTLVGGHSVDDPEPKFGLAVTGLVDPARVVTNAGARPGDLLVITKPIGTGVIASALKAGRADPAVVAEAVAVMAALNDGASRAMLDVGVHAATDVTGFGLVGHLGEMLAASGAGADLDAAAVPLLPGAFELAEAGVYPGGSERNLEAARGFTDFGDTPEPLVRLLADAQTSGGLLVAVAPGKADALVGALEAVGAVAAVVGEITDRAGVTVR